MAMNRRLRNAMIVFLSTFFLFQSYTNVSEFLKNPSATKSGQRGLSGVAVPTITICPGYGFEDSVLSKLGYSDYYSYLLGQGNIKDEEGDTDSPVYGWVGQGRGFIQDMNMIENSQK